MKTIMYFSAAWCSPCKGYKPKFEKMATTHSDKATFEVVDIDVDSDKATKFNIRGVPTVVITEDGAEVTRATGVALIEKALDFLK